MMSADRLECLAEEWRRRAEERAEEGALLDGGKLYEKVVRELEAALREHMNEELTVAEAAEESGYSEDSLREMVREGRIPDTRPPGSQGRIKIKRKFLPRKPPEPESPDLDVVEKMADEVS